MQITSKKKNLKIIPLSNWEVEEGNVDILVRVIVGNESRPLLHHKPLASVLQIRLEPQVLVGNGFLEKIIELHHVREVDEHRARLAPSHRLDLRLVVRLRRIIPNPKAEIPSTNFHKKYTDIYIHTHTHKNTQNFSKIENFTIGKAKEETFGGSRGKWFRLERLFHRRSNHQMLPFSSSSESDSETLTLSLSLSLSHSE